MRFYSLNADVPFIMVFTVSDYSSFCCFFIGARKWASKVTIALKSALSTFPGGVDRNCAQEWVVDEIQKKLGGNFAISKASHAESN